MAVMRMLVRSIVSGSESRRSKIVSIALLALIVSGVALLLGRGLHHRRLALDTVRQCTRIGDPSGWCISRLGGLEQAVQFRDRYAAVARERCGDVVGFDIPQDSYSEVRKWSSGNRRFNLRGQYVAQFCKGQFRIVFALVDDEWRVVESEIWLDPAD